MSSPKKIISDNAWLLILAAAGVLIHIFPFSDLGFHRDEFLYLMLGKHLATGFWSNPPLIGVISWLGQLLPGDSLLKVRLLPALAGGLLIFLSGLIARELGGKRFAQVSAALAVMSSLIFMRAFSMLQPVPFDILFWTLILYVFLKYINSENKMYLVLTGVFFGLGMLNKYMVVFLAAGLMMGILVTPYRKLWVNKYLWLAVLIAFVTSPTWDACGTAMTYFPVSRILEAVLCSRSHTINTRVTGSISSGQCQASGAILAAPLLSRVQTRITAPVLSNRYALSGGT